MNALAQSLFWWVLAIVLLARWRLFVRPSTLTMQLAQMRDASPGTLRGLLFFLALLAIGGAAASSISVALTAENLGVPTEVFEMFNQRYISAVEPGAPQRLIFIVFAFIAVLIGLTVFFWVIRARRLQKLSRDLDEEVTTLRRQRDGVGNSRHFSEAVLTALQEDQAGQSARLYVMGDSVLIETQPKLEKAQLSKAVPFLAEGIGNFLLLAAAISLWVNLPEFATLDSVIDIVQVGEEPTEQNLLDTWMEFGSLTPWILTFLILGGFGKWFLGLSEVFLGETNFRSFLMRAQLRGEETNVEQAIGKAAFDTFETKVSVPYMNGVMEAQSVMLHTCSFARPNRLGLMGPRSVLEFGSDNGFMEEQVNSAIKSLDELRFIPQLQNRDLTSVQQASDINKVHAQTVYHNPDPALPGTTSPAQQVGFSKDDDDDPNV